MSIQDAGDYEIYDRDPGLYDDSQSADTDYDYYSEERDERPSDITLRGTSTTNPNRPRTVAAGYDKKTQTLTVVFRENKWWNYYDVPEYMWQEFIAAESKGKYLRESGLDAWDNMGPSNMSDLGYLRRKRLDYLARKARKNQIKAGGEQKYGNDRGFDLKDWFNKSRGEE